VNRVKKDKKIDNLSLGEGECTVTKGPKSKRGDNLIKQLQNSEGTVTTGKRHQMVREMVLNRPALGWR
jgi:hypothetical protein